MSGRGVKYWELFFIQYGPIRNTDLRHGFANALKPFALKCAPISALHYPIYRHFYSVCPRQKRITERGLTDEPNNGCCNVLILRLLPCTAKVGFREPLLIERHAKCL